MFVGHYSMALAAKAIDPRISAGKTFFAVQFLDILWAPLILLGVEHARLIPGFLPASPLDLYDMPWSHSLVMAMAWSWLAFRFLKSPLIGACVFSHWVLDFIAHRPDLAIIRGRPYLGLGLWRNREVTLVVEVGLLLVGLWLYLRNTRPKSDSAGGRYGMIGFCGILAALEIYNLYGPTGGSMAQVAITGELAFLAFSLLAARFDVFREPVPEPVLSITGS